MLRNFQRAQSTAAFHPRRSSTRLSNAALTAGSRVRVVNHCPPVGGPEGEVVGRHGVVFHVKLDGLGTRYFEPEELERVRD